MISMQSMIQSDSEGDLSGRLCDCGPPTGFCNVSPLKDDEDFGCFGPLKNLGPKVMVPEDWPWLAAVAQDKSPTSSPRRMNSYSFDSANSQSSQVLIHNAQISGTVTAREQRGTGTHPYTLYTVKVRHSCCK